MSCDLTTAQDEENAADGAGEAYHGVADQLQVKNVGLWEATQIEHTMHTCILMSIS